MAIRPNQCLNNNDIITNKLELQIDNALNMGFRNITVDANADIVIRLVSKYRYAGWTIRYFHKKDTNYELIFA